MNGATLLARAGRRSKVKRRLNLAIYYGLLGLALIGLSLVSRPRGRFVLISLAAAIIIYVIVTHSPLRWTLPRRRRHVPSIAVCFLGALLVSLATRDPSGEGMAVTWVAAALGAFGFLLMAVKSGTPTHVGILVNAESVSAHWNGVVPDVDRGRRVANRMFDLGSFFEPDFVNRNFGVWPEHFEVPQEGSITWYIKGRPGTRATIRFDQGFDPFSEPNGQPSVFEAVVPSDGPGIAVAGPVVEPGRGAYTIQIESPGQPVRAFVVRGGGSQTKG
jgi:hypothetical protein